MHYLISLSPQWINQLKKQKVEEKRGEEKFRIREKRKCNKGIHLSPSNKPPVYWVYVYFNEERRKFSLSLSFRYTALSLLGTTVLPVNPTRRLTHSTGGQNAKWIVKFHFRPRGSLLYSFDYVETKSRINREQSSEGGLMKSLQPGAHKIPLLSLSPLAV